MSRLGSSGVTLAALLLAAAGAALAHPDEEIARLEERSDAPDTVLSGSHERGEAHRLFVLRPLPGAEDVEVDVQSRVRRGEIAWRLVDHQGEEVINAWADDGSLRGGSGRLACAGGRCRGDWRLELRVDGRATWTLRAWGMKVVEGTEDAD